MDLNFLALLTVGLMFFGGVATTRSEHEDGMEQRLRVLEAKFEKFDILLEGFEQLCSKLTKSNIKSGQELDHETDKKDDHVSNTEMTIPKPELVHDEVKQVSEEDIEMISIESTGLVDDKINVSVAFLAQVEYYVVWWQSRMDSEFAVYKGTIATEAVAEPISAQMVSANHTIYDVDSIRSCIMMITTKSKNIHISFDILALNESGTQYFDEIVHKISKFTPIVRVPSKPMLQKGGNRKQDRINTTIEVSENVVESLNRGMSIVETFFTGVNTTKMPEEIFELWEIDYEEGPLSYEVKNGSNNELVLYVDKEYAKFGGFLTIRLSQNASGYLRDYSYGIVMKLVNEDVNNIMPTGTIAFQKHYQTVYIRGEYHSFRCSAAGIPVPKLNIFKLRKDGTFKEIKPDTSILHDFFRTEAIHFDPRKAAKPEGTYICRASNENRVVEYNTTVVRHEEVKIDDRKTGLTKSTTKKTVITCKASGMPTPELELRVNDIYGDNLLMLEDDQYKHKMQTRKNMAKVALAITPPDPKIHTVFCIARQDIPPYGDILKERRIMVKHNPREDDNSYLYGGFANYTIPEYALELMTSPP